MEEFKGLDKIMEKAKESRLSEDFSRVSVLLNEGLNKTRERMQSMTSKDMKDILNKLDKDQPLTFQELEYVKLWIIGDAESYLEMENSFDKWIAEFDRLKNVLSGYESRDLSLPELAKAHGVLEDASRVSADIANYLEKKERVEKFSQATKDPLSLDTEVLRKILRLKFQSPNM
ncbi:MAG: hypothetical protein KAI91_00760 [Candidatus Omnitrophica bacterium]|nr:hypothetical protein [Candidatus Omnitrophota bacterium]MCK5288016.1 hypothetical protein [Candidatus Omnitrophota bacterium]MCK5392838.1 hypothetical protein [Candidatus Omnitrophota bacterium]